MGKFEDAGKRLLPRAIDWLKCVICQKETTEKPWWPVNWKRHDSGAGYLTFEEDFQSFYEAGELNLTVDWKYFDVRNGIVSTIASHLVCGIDLDAMCSTG